MKKIAYALIPNQTNDSIALFSMFVNMGIVNFSSAQVKQKPRIIVWLDDNQLSHIRSQVKLTYRQINNQYHE
jgi:hypothetical protein